MGNDTTPEQITAQDEFDEAIISDPVQRHGYVRVYRAVIKDAGLEAALLYGVLEDYAMLSIRNRRACVPTQANLAERIGVPVRSVQRWTAKLRERGWITTAKLSNGRMRYTITSAEERQLLVNNPPAKSGGRVGVDNNPPAKSGGSHPPKMAAAYNKQDQARTNNPPTPHEPPASESKDSISQIQSKPEMGVSDGGATEKTGVPKSDATPKNPGLMGREMQHDYWNNPKFGEQRQTFFRAVFNLYPKREQEASAMAAWRQVVGARLDGKGKDDPMLRAIWFAAQWYARKVKHEGTDDKYITSFPNWIRGERWLDAPESVREGKPQ